MNTYIMMGKYSAEAVKDFSPNRTDKAVRLINDLGGKIHSMYGVLGEYDLILIVDFPNIEVVMKASLGLNLLTGISFNSYPAVPVDDFDRVIGEK